MLLAALLAALGEEYGASAGRATLIVVVGGTFNWFAPGSLLCAVEAVLRAVHSAVDIAVFRYNIKLGSSIVVLIQTGRIASPAFGHLYTTSAPALTRRIAQNVR